MTNNISRIGLNEYSYGSNNIVQGNGLNLFFRECDSNIDIAISESVRQYLFVAYYVGYAGMLCQLLVPFIYVYKYWLSPHFFAIVYSLTIVSLLSVVRATVLFFKVQDDITQSITIGYPLFITNILSATYSIWEIVDHIIKKQNHKTR